MWDLVNAAINVGMRVTRQLSLQQMIADTWAPGYWALIFTHNLTLMIDEHDDEGEDIDADEGKSDGEGEREDVNMNWEWG